MLPTGLLELQTCHTLVRQKALFNVRWAQRLVKTINSLSLFGGLERAYYTFSFHCTLCKSQVCITENSKSKKYLKKLSSFNPGATSMNLYVMSNGNFLVSIQSSSLFVKIQVLILMGQHHCLKYLSQLFSKQ